MAKGINPALNPKGKIHKRWIKRMRDWAARAGNADFIRHVGLAIDPDDGVPELTKLADEYDANDEPNPSSLDNDRPMPTIEWQVQVKQYSEWTPWDHEYDASSYKDAKRARNIARQKGWKARIVEVSAT
jgi:hypothetical protein